MPPNGSWAARWRCKMQTSDIKNLITIYMGRDNVGDLTINGFDTALYAVNAARRIAERMHDFRYAETNCFLSIGTQGGSINSGYSTGTLTVASSGSPSIDGTYNLVGSYNGFPLWAKDTAGQTYYVAKNSTGWQLSSSVLNATNAYTLTTASASPNGTYAAAGSYTGTPAISSAGAPVGIKRVKYVSLPLNSGDYEPIEFLTYERFLARVRMQTGRQHFDPNKALANLGATLLGNPLCYQNGQTLYLGPSSLPLPMVAQLSVVQWMPDYVLDTDADFFTLHGTEFLQWQGILECNKFWKRFTERQEGNVDEAAAAQMAGAALQSLIEWDTGVPRGTSERQPEPPTPAPAAPQPAGP
jgi:hypothetical protein